MAKIKIIYGSCGGNTEMVCKRVAETFEKTHETELCRAKSSTSETVDGCDLLVLASPTYGHGVLEPYFEEFMNKIKDVDFKGRKCTIIGLGDPKYEPDYHLESIKIIMDFLKKKEAVLVGMPLRVSKSPLPLMDYIDRWAEKLSELMKNG